MSALGRCGCVGSEGCGLIVNDQEELPSSSG